MKSISLAVPKSILVCASSPITISVASKEVIAVIAPDADAMSVPFKATVMPLAISIPPSSISSISAPSIYIEIFP